MSIPEEGHPQGGSGSGSGATTATGEPRRRIGRPIAYTGDPDAQHLTEIERRRIKRHVPAHLQSLNTISCQVASSVWRCGAVRPQPDTAA